MLGLLDTTWPRTGLLATVLLATAFCADTRAAPYQARYEVMIESAAQRELSHGMLWLALPVAAAADTEIADLADPGIEQDSIGNRQLVLSLDSVPLGYQRKLSVIVTVGEQAAADPPAAVVAPAQSATHRYLWAEPLLEVDAPQLRAKSTALRGPDAGVTVANVTAFIASLKPAAAPAAAPVAGPPGVNESETTARGALAALRADSVDAVDRVLLTLALLRAASIPARAVAGFFDDGDGVLAGDEMRLWVEYRDQNRWRSTVGEPGEGRRSIVFRIFASADEIAPRVTADNFYRAVGLKMRSMH